MTYQKLPEHLIVPFYYAFHLAAECPSLRTNCLGIVIAESCMCIKVVQMKPMVANSCATKKQLADNLPNQLMLAAYFFFGICYVAGKVI
jgi:hypothetical protein